MRCQAGQILDGAEVGEEIEPLAQGDVDALETAADGVVTGPFRATWLRSIDSQSAVGMYSP